MCLIALEQPISMDLEKNNHTCLIAQIFPSFKDVSLRNKCVLTCDEHKDGLGGIMAFESTSLLIDGTSKIDMSGKGTSKDFCHRLQNQQHSFFMVKPLYSVLSFAYSYVIKYGYS